MIQTGKGKLLPFGGIYIMDEHLMYRNQLIKQISTLQSVDVSLLKRELEAAQHDLVYKLYTLADEVKTTLVRNPAVDEERLTQLLEQFERAMRGEREPVMRDATYDEVILRSIDSLDRLRENADPQSIVYAQVTTEINEYLDELALVQINEIALPGDPYESTYMIAREEISVDKVEEGFEIGQVHRVLERGFVDMETGAILRKATIEIVVAPASRVEQQDEPLADDDAEQ